MLFIIDNPNLARIIPVMRTGARIIKALRENKLLQGSDHVTSAIVSGDKLSNLNGEVLVLVKKRKMGEKKDKVIAPETLSHFTFSDGKNSFLFVSRDKNRVGAIADFIIDLMEVEEEETC